MVVPQMLYIADLINDIELNKYKTHMHIDTHINMHMFAGRGVDGGARPGREPSSAT